MKEGAASTITEQALYNTNELVPDGYWSALQKKMQTFEIAKESEIDIDVDFLEHRSGNELRKNGQGSS